MRGKNFERPKNKIKPVTERLMDDFPLPITKSKYKMFNSYINRCHWKNTGNCIALSTISKHYRTQSAWYISVLKIFHCFEVEFEQRTISKTSQTSKCKLFGLWSKFILWLYSISKDTTFLKVATTYRYFILLAGKDILLWLYNLLSERPSRINFEYWRSNYACNSSCTSSYGWSF
jgi:hypothetical protein